MSAADPYRYWAFVSYSHHDARVARQLTDRLARVAVRGAARKRVAGAPARFAPLFVDTREAAAAPRLDDELQRRLRESARLIVLCSPFAALSREVAAEIRYFQSIGREADILCLIVSGLTDAAAKGQPVLECLPAPLRPKAAAGGRAPRPLAASLGAETEAEWQHAVEQIAAGLVGVSLAEWRRLGGARRRRQWLGAGAGVLALAAAAYAAAWAWWLPQQVFAKDGVRRWGQWEPVDIIDADTAARRPVSVRFERQGALRPFTELRWLDGDGRCADEGPPSVVGEAFEFKCSRSRACGVRLEPGEGGVATEEVFDQYGQVVETLSYLDRTRAVLQEAAIGCSRRPGEIESVHFEREAEGPLAGLDRRRRFSGGDDKAPRPNASYAFGLHEEFDTAGRLRLRRLLDAQGAPTVGAFGYSALRHRRDETGDIVESTFLGLDERPVEDRDGRATVTFQRDALGRIVDERYLDADGRPTHDARGSYGRHRRWDDRGRATETVNLGADGRPQVDPDGVAVERSTHDPEAGGRRTAYFDAAGRPTLHGRSGCAIEDHLAPHDAAWEETRCLDAEGRPQLGAQGWHLRRRSFSALGQMLDEAFFDTAGQPTLCTDEDQSCPHHRWTSTFDERGNAVRSRALGTDGRPIVAPYGTIGVDMVVNARNRIQRRIFIGADGRPTRNRDGEMAREYIYDSYGRVVETRAVDAGGAPLPRPNGWFADRSTYDARGNIVVTELVDVEGRPVADDRDDGDGWATARRRFDARGRMTEIRTFDARGQPMPNRQGWYGEAVVHDAWGRQRLWTRLGADGRPEPDADGMLTRRAAFDVRGHRTRLTLHGVDGRLKARADGMALWHEERDARGRLLLALNVGPFGQLVADADGTAGFRARYDERGNRTVIVYLGADGRPAVDRAEGCAASVWTYDARNRQVGEACFDAQARPLAESDGIHRRAYAYDEKDRNIEMVNQDALGRPAASVDGVARVLTLYDAAGGVAEGRYLGLDGKPTRGAQAPIVRHRNDAWGRELERSFFDADDRPTASPGSGRWRARFVRDAYGRLLVEESLDGEGRPVNRSDTGWFRRSWRYGDMGQVVEVICVDAAERPVARCSAQD